MTLREELNYTNHSLLGFKENVDASPVQEDKEQKSYIARSKPQTIKPIVLWFLIQGTWIILITYK